MRKGAKTAPFCFGIRTSSLHICFVDEAGEPGRFISSSNESQPIFALIGLIVASANLRSLTEDFVELKRRSFPSLFPQCDRNIDGILMELKGADLRRSFGRSANRDRRRVVSHFLTKLLDLLEKYQCKILGNVYAKKPDADTKPASMYTFSVQYTCNFFQRFLSANNSLGIVIADHRNPNLNVNVSHSIYTQMFQKKGDRYRNIVDLPTFGHSENHAGLQICDVLCSALIFPMATHAFYIQDQSALKNKHVQQGFAELRDLFAVRIAKLQYRCESNKELPNGRLMKEGGIRVSNKYNDIPNNELFRSAKPSPPKQRRLNALINKFSAQSD